MQETLADYRYVAEHLPDTEPNIKILQVVSVFSPMSQPWMLMGLSGVSGQTFEAVNDLDKICMFALLW